MAGHSHWANIARKKGAVDAKRGKLFGKLSRAIIVAAQSGGGDPATNLRLRYAIEKARQASMPKDTIERAIRKGTGEDSGGSRFEELVYEGYGPGGVAILCDILTDNRNRTASEVRKIFEIHGGSLGGSGSVLWMFSVKGIIQVDKSAVDEERLLEIALESGAEDVKDEGEYFEVVCDPDSFPAVRDALEAAGIKYESAEIRRVPTTTVDLDAETGRKVLKLINALEEQDDVQSVTANFNIPDEVMQEVMNEA